jgi:hypothetical protein
MDRVDVMRTTGLMVAALLLVAAEPARAQAPAGVTAAVNPQVTGTPPAELPRVLEIGADVVENEHIAAGPAGQAQLLFRDGSTLTLAPGSDLTIDEFVYNPETKTAKLAMTAAVGVFRFVGGRASKDEPVVINTPTATIGIRGGINVTGVDANGATDTTQLFGRDTSMTAKGTGETKTTFKNGFTLTIGGPGQSIVASRLDLARLNARLGALEGQSGHSGGAATPPDQTSPAAQTVAISNSNLSPQSIAPTGPLSVTTPINSILNNANQLTAQTAQTIASSSGTLPSGSYAYGIAFSGQNPDIFANSPFSTNTVTGTASGFSTTITSSDSTFLTLNGQGVPVQINDQSSFASQTTACMGCNSAYSYNTTYTFTNIAVQELGGDSTIQFGRITGALNVSSNGSGPGGALGPSFHFIYGVPATQLPLSGQYTFNLLGATSPTFSNGSGTPGSFTGSLSVLFGINGNQIFPGYTFTSNTNGFVVGLNATVTMPGDGVYQLTTIGGLSNPAQQLSNLGAVGTIFGGNLIFGVNGPGLFYGNPTASGTGRTCTSSGCSSYLYGFLAGAGATHAGITYIIFPNGCSGGSCGIPAILGVAAFKR